MPRDKKANQEKSSKAVPFTRFSLDGQDLYEKRKIKEGGSSGGAFATIADSTLEKSRSNFSFATGDSIQNLLLLGLFFMVQIY